MKEINKFNYYYVLISIVILSLLVISGLLIYNIRLTRELNEIYNELDECIKANEYYKINTQVG